MAAGNRFPFISVHFRQIRQQLANLAGSRVFNERAGSADVAKDNVVRRCNSYGVAESPRSVIGPTGVCCETVSRNPSDAKRTQASIEIHRPRKRPLAARAAAADRQKRDRTPGGAADEVVTVAEFPRIRTRRCLRSEFWRIPLRFGPQPQKVPHQPPSLLEGQRRSRGRPFVVGCARVGRDP